MTGTPHDDRRWGELAALWPALTDRQRRGLLVVIRRFVRQQRKRRDDLRHVATFGNARETIVEGVNHAIRGR